MYTSKGKVVCVCVCVCVCEREREREREEEREKSVIGLKIWVCFSNSFQVLV